MAFKIFKCEKCGEEIKLGPGQEAWHSSCKKRGPKAAPPQYVEKEA